MKVSNILFSSVSFSARELRTFRVLGGSLDSLGIGVTTAFFPDATNQSTNTVRLRLILAWEGSSSERREILRRSFLALPTRLALPLQRKIARSRAGARLRHPYLRHPTLAGRRSLARGETFLRDIVLQQNIANVKELDSPLVSQTAIVTHLPALLQGRNAAIQEVANRNSVVGRTLLTPTKDPVASASEGEAAGRPQRRVVLVHFPSLGANTTGSTRIFRAQSVPGLLTLPALPLQRNPTKKASVSTTREQNIASLTHIPTRRASQRPSLWNVSIGATLQYQVLGGLFSALSVLSTPSFK